MTSRTGDAIAIGVMLYALLRAKRERVGVAILEPLEQVGAIGNTSPVGGMPTPYVSRPLCEAAPLNSFGPACRGVTWDIVNGQRVEFRTKVTPL